MACCFGAGSKAESLPVSPLPVRHQPPRQAVQRQLQSHPTPPALEPPQSSVTPTNREVSFSRRPLPAGCRRFLYRELQEATNGFQQLLGEGGFGQVYRGTLSNGKVVAIKKLDRLGLQGDKEFEVEINALASLRHSNLVTLLGACTENKNRIAVFDFMPYGSLRDCLDRQKENGRAKLLWPARLWIALGAASGLAYLHEGVEPGMIHRDVKSSNVLIDADGHARIADFGLALPTGHLSGPSASHYETPSTDADMMTGTYGYTSPEYVKTGRMSQRSDVYAFGVVLLELLTGCEPIDPSRPESMRPLVAALVPVLQREDPEEIEGYLDKALLDEKPAVIQLVNFCEVALGCLQKNPKDRPSMSAVAKKLTSIYGFKEDPAPRGGSAGAARGRPSGTRRLSSDTHRSTGHQQLLMNLMDAHTDVPPVRHGVDLCPTPPASTRTPFSGLQDYGMSSIAESPLTHAVSSPQLIRPQSPGIDALQSSMSDMWPSMPVSVPVSSPQQPLGTTGQPKMSGNPFAAQYHSDRAAYGPLGSSIGQMPNTGAGPLEAVAHSQGKFSPAGLGQSQPLSEFLTNQRPASQGVVRHGEDSAWIDFHN